MDFEEETEDKGEKRKTGAGGGAQREGNRIVWKLDTDEAVRSHLVGDGDLGDGEGQGDFKA